MSGSLARRYARALLQLGTEEGSFDRMGNEVQGLADAVHSSKDLSEVLSNPAFPRSEREQVLQAIAERVGASQTVKNFARLLLDRERVNILPDVARELSALIDEKAGRVKAIATAAIPLSSNEAENLVRALEKRSGKKVELETRRDPNLLGGVVAKLGDTVYDGSLRTQLKRLQEHLGGAS
jgi:F-type H+-transporting ATPase subunit delta